MISGPVQPQCFCSVNEPTPWISAAGFARVNAVQRKLLSDQEAKLLSSTITISGNELVVRKASQN